MNAILLPSLLLACAADDPPPAPKLPLGKATTFVTGPLDGRGYIDYEAALNAEVSKGVTRENNANALLLLVLGPKPEGGELRPEYYKWLDIPAPPADGAYFLTTYKFNRDSLRLSPEQMEALDEFQGRAAQRAWLPKDCPPLVEWLEANDKPLALLVEATKRPEYFNPLVSRRKDGEPTALIGALLSTVQKCRGLALALADRATLRLGEKKYDEAWGDILACHRLGRLVARGATLIELLVGIAIGNLANNATLAYLDRAPLTAAQARGRLKDLRALPPMPPVADKIHLAERMMTLDTLQVVRRGEPTELGFAFETDRKPTADERKALEEVDWAAAMRSVNAWYDRLVAAMRIADRSARERALDAIDKELAAVRKTTGESSADFPLGVLLELVAKKGADKVVGQSVGDLVASAVLPSVRRVHHAHDRFAQWERNLSVAFALAAYRADNGRYPEALADLAPKYLAAVPDDLFNGKPLTYKPSETGYRFYSVGPDGKDDGGRGPGDDPPGDDLGVRMPLPELKKK
jgi:hypothetical protein